MKKISTILLGILCGLLVSVCCSCFFDSENPITPNYHPVHYFSEWESDKEFTCTSGGTQHRTCFCGERQTRTVEPLGHSWTASSQDDLMVCSVCGATTSSADSDGSDGNSSDINNGTTDSKPNEGGTVDSKPSDDETADSNQEEKPDAPHTHNYTNWEIVKDSTCYEDGLKQGKCSCGIVNSVTIEKKTHNFVHGYCSNCNTQKPISQGLKYTLSEDKTYYLVSGMGSCKDVDILIPSTYNDLPVLGIGRQAFYRNDDIQSVSFEKDSQLTTFYQDAFNDCDKLVYAEIPSSVTTIDEYAFASCGLTSINIPSNTTIIGAGAFSRCHYLSSINVEEGNTEYKSIDGNLYSKDGKTLIQYALGKANPNVSISNDVTSINDYAFLGCTTISSVSIPNSVTNIGSLAFSECSALTSVYVPSSVTSIGYDVFCSLDIKTIFCEAESKPEEWNSYWNSTNVRVVWNCKNNDIADDGCICINIADVLYVIKDGVASITYTSPNIEGSIVIPSSITHNGISYPVTSIEKCAFSCRNGITHIELPNTITSIGRYAFYECDGLESFVIPNGVVSIGNSAFANCDNLISVIIPNSVTNIEMFAFSACYNLTIYCEVESWPEGWVYLWNYSDRPIEWGYKQKN